MKGIFLACVSLCVLNLALANPVEPVLCVSGNETYADGESWSEDCSARCTCYVVSGEAAIGCVSMCPPSLPSPGCHFEENPDKDVDNSLNCCDIEVCEPVMCEIGDKKYADGESWSEGCSAVCTCHITNGQVSMGCVSMCPPSQPAPGCHLVENPDKDVANSLNCCDIQECDPDCIEDGVTIPAGTIMKLGDKFCGCLAGETKCFP